MGFFSFLAGKTPEDLEYAGDKLYKAEEFGAAKLEYEKAARKAAARSPEKASLVSRLDQKITDARESLAKRHFKNSRELLDAGNDDEAMDLLDLALELTKDDRLRREIETFVHAQAEPGRTGDFRASSGPGVGGTPPLPHDRENDEPGGNSGKGIDDGPDNLAADSGDGNGDDDEDYFFILINALPEDLRDAYETYSPAFRQGYIALNNGAFENAVAHFTRAMHLPGLHQPLIPVELATALIHLSQYDPARELLEDFIADHPDDIRAYQTLCDLYWVTEDYSSAVRLIDQAPSPFNETLPVKMLLGETCLQMKQYETAKDLFVSIENQFGENEMVSRSLARIYEATGDVETARDIYAKILNGCARCGVRQDPFIKQRYAELCFACGERSERLLNLYLSLVLEIPDNKENYYEWIYQLYEALGNPAEARRYRALMQ